MAYLKEFTCATIRRLMEKPDERLAREDARFQRITASANQLCVSVCVWSAPALSCVKIVCQVTQESRIHPHTRVPRHSLARRKTEWFERSTMAPGYWKEPSRNLQVRARLGQLVFRIFSSSAGISSSFHISRRLPDSAYFTIRLSAFPFAELPSHALCICALLTFPLRSTRSDSLFGSLAPEYRLCFATPLFSTNSSSPCRR